MRTGGWIMKAVAAVGGLTLAAAGLVTPVTTTAAGATTAGSTGVSAPGRIVPVVYDPTSDPHTTVGPVVPNGQLHASSGGGATFVVNYDAGFDANPAAKAAFQFAVDQWSRNISSPVPIVVDASFGPLGTGILGGAGPSSLRANFSGAPVANTWYPMALANALHGSDLDGTIADIDATFSSTYGNFYFGTDGNTGGKVDFASVVMHELGHGLGFLGLMDVSSGSGSCCLGSPYPSIYDRFTTSNGTDLLSIPNGASLATALQGQTVRFTGPKATAANGGTAPRLYAPASWQSGSSYSHLDESTFPAGNVDSLMTPGIGSDEVIHAPGPIALGVFADSGWTVGAPPKISIGTARMMEGNGGSRFMRFNVSLSAPAARSVTVNYATADLTASAGSDYVARSGTLTIPAGATKRPIAVTITGDRTVEPTERFKVVLSNPSGADLGPATAAGVILNDDTATGVRLAMSDATIGEGNSGDRSVTLEVTLSVVRSVSTTVDWATAPGTANAGSDFDTASGTVTIPAGSTTAYVNVNVHPDTTVEGNETFTVTLSNPSASTILGRPTGTATIADDD